MKLLIKIFASLVSALVGLILIPTLALDRQIVHDWPLLIIYFLPGFSIALFFLFEFLTRVRRLKAVYEFIQSKKMFVLFLALLFVEWILIWGVEHSNDVIFTSMFATATIPAILLYSWIARRCNFFRRE